MSATVTAARPGIASRLWAGYLRQLALRPLRTKMVTSGSMFIIGDTIAQVGIEGRRIGGEPEPEGYEVADNDVVLAYNVGSTLVGGDTLVHDYKRGGRVAEEQGEV